MVEAISFSNEISHSFSSVSPSFTICCVSTNWRLLVSLIIVDSVFGVVTNHVRVHERRVHEAGYNLAVESDVALAALLGVSDVQESSLSEIVLVWLASFQVVRDFLTADRDSTTHSVLSFENVVTNGCKGLLVASSCQREHLCLLAYNYY